MKQRATAFTGFIPLKSKSCFLKAERGESLQPVLRHSAVQMGIITAYGQPLQILALREVFTAFNVYLK